MSKLHDNKIHTLQIGVSTNPMTYTVGREVRRGDNKYVICRLERNENYFYEFGEIAYEVWGKLDDGEEELLNAYIGHPISMTFFSKKESDI